MPNDSESKDDAERGARPPTKEEMEKLYQWASKAASAATRRYGSGIEADDVVQDALFAIFTRMDRLPHDFWDNEQRARAYVMTVIRHRMLDAYRRESRQKRVSLDAVEGLPSVHIQRTPGLEADLQEALATLSKDDATFIQARLAGQTLSETAIELGIDVPTASRKMNRAMMTLRSALQGELIAKQPPAPDLEGDEGFPDPGPELDGIELYLDAGEASEHDVRAVLRALNDLHKASGGLGLEFRIDGTFVRARQAVPV